MNFESPDVQAAIWRPRVYRRLAVLVFLGAVPTFAQTFDCYNYGSFSQCQMPNGSQIECRSYNAGAYSSCQVTHANGFVSAEPRASGGGAGGALILLVEWMARKHAEHVTDKAMENASATVSLTIKHSVHLMDLSALAAKLLPYMPPEQKEQWEHVTKNLADQSSTFSGAVASFSANWNVGTDRSRFHHEAKKMEQLYDNGLLAVCGARADSRVLSMKLDSMRANLPADILQALDAVKGDEALLSTECDSERALKLLKKQAEKAKHPGN